MSKFLHENSKSKKGHNFVKKIGGLPSLLIWVLPLIVNNYSEFQVNIFSKVITEIFENVKVFARRRRRRRRQGYDNTSTFSSKTAELKIKAPE